MSEDDSAIRGKGRTLRPMSKQSLDSGSSSESEGRDGTPSPCKRTARFLKDSDGNKKRMAESCSEYDDNHKKEDPQVKQQKRGIVKRNSRPRKRQRD